MQSPLQHLLEQVEARCEPSECSSLAAAAGEAARQAPRVPLFAEVLAVLLQPNVQGCAPDEEHVASCKQRGTAAFSRGHYRQAAQLFSEALRYCDESASGTAGAQLAAKLYCNRALCLSKLDPPLLEAALQDSSAAIACDPSFAKAWYRRACTARALGRTAARTAVDGGSTPSSALQDAKQALRLLQEQGGDASEAAALVAELEAELAPAQQQHEQQRQQGDSTTAAASPYSQPEGGSAPAPAAYANGHATVAELEAAAVASARLAEAADSLHQAHPPPQSPAAATSAAGAPPAGLQHLLQAAGPQLTVQESADQGRLLAAAEHLPAGQDVLRERPFAFALTKRGRRSVCATCLAPMSDCAAPYYCRLCPMPAYCSAACRATDAFHQPGGPECGRPWTVLLPAEALAALRVARQLAASLGHDAAVAADGMRIRQVSGPATSGAPPLASSAAAARQVASLSTHFEQLDPTEVTQLAALAAVTHATWRHAAAEAAAAAESPAGHWQAAEAEAAAGSSIGGSGSRNSSSEVSVAGVLAALCLLQINGLAVVPPQRRDSDDRLALALYPVGSLMNHACLPNVAARFEGSQLVVRTLETLPPGQPLLHCYGPQAGEMTAAQRRRLLQQQYHFNCRCRACSAAVEAGGQLADVAPAGLKCPAGSGSRCEGAVLPACSVPAGVLHRYQLPAGSGACCGCGSRLSADTWQEVVLPELQAAAEAHAAAAAVLARQEGQRQGAAPSGGGSTAAQQQAVQQAIRGLRQALRQRQAHLHPHNLLLGATHDELAHAWHLAGNQEAAAQHLRHSLAVLQRAYPPGSTAVAFQQQQLAQALRLAAAAASASGGGGATAEALLAEARQAEEAADRVLELHFGGQLG